VNGPGGSSPRERTTPVGRGPDRYQRDPGLSTRRPRPRRPLGAFHHNHLRPPGTKISWLQRGESIFSHTPRPRVGTHTAP